MSQQGPSGSTSGIGLSRRLSPIEASRAKRFGEVRALEERNARPEYRAMLAALFKSKKSAQAKVPTLPRFEKFQLRRSRSLRPRQGLGCKRMK